MNLEQHLLIKLAEECAEVIQRITKALRFGMHEVQPKQDLNNIERIINEVLDVYAIIEYIENNTNISFRSTYLDNQNRLSKIKKYIEFSKEQGILNE